MEVIVLPPQDILKRQTKPRRNPNHSLTNPSYQPTRSNRTSKRRNSNSPPKAQSGPTGPIRILKRGENLPIPEQKPKPKPEISWPVVGPIINGFYAGSACVTSPPPSELPLPAFFTRSCGLASLDGDVSETVKIASDLRRVLKLC